jgi:ABC-type uncharacterized transport system involved in gliding motility auxiliary subunit
MKKKHESLIYSAVGLAALFLILVAFNYLASTAPLRADLTDGKLYTLSEGTKKILKGLSAPVKVKLYVSQGEAMPVPLRGFAQRVEDTVREFKSVAGPNLVVEKYNPKPDSEEEDAAQIDGIEPQQLYTGESFYLGIAVSRLDRRQSIPAISPQRERLLEYDLVRAIARVGSAERPTIGLMAGLPVTGERFNMMTRQSSDPWVLANELKRDYEVKEIGLTATEIDPEIGVLLLIHPRDITPQTEYALDQFVLRGGKLIAFVDPYAYFDQQAPQFPGAPPIASSSTLPTLFKAWGIAMNPDKVLADVVYASGQGQRYTPTVLSLNRNAFSHDDVVTSQIETLLYPFGGAFTFIKDDKPAEGLTAADLVRSSQNSMLVDSSLATRSGDDATKTFKASGIAYPLALRLAGRFKTAFPGGRPADHAAPGAKGKKAAAPAAQLTESAKENSVVLVADVDMLNDGAAVDIQQVFGRKIVVPSNGNLAFALGLVEQLAAGDDLTSLRSRASAFRPLTVVRQLEAEAQQRYLGEIQGLEAELEKTTAKLQELQKSRGAGQQSAQILTPEQQAELENFRKKVAESKLALKEVRKSLRRDAESLLFWTKVVNIALVPILVALAGLIVALLRRRRLAAGRDLT